MKNNMFACPLCHPFLKYNIVPVSVLMEICKKSSLSFQNCFLQGRLKPGRMLLVDTHEKIVTKDEELKLQIARSRPHSMWIKEQVGNALLLIAEK